MQGKNKHHQEDEGVRIDDLTDKQIDSLLIALDLMQFLDKDAPRFMKIQRLIEHQLVDPEALEKALNRIKG